jgi:hypothetical protein
VKADLPGRVSFWVQISQWKSLRQECGKLGKGGLQGGRIEVQQLLPGDDDYEAPRAPGVLQAMRSGEKPVAAEAGDTKCPAA